jgi:hypothetical protein
VRSGSSGVGEDACAFAAGFGFAACDATAEPENASALQRTTAAKPTGFTVRNTRTE